IGMFVAGCAGTKSGGFYDFLAEDHVHQLKPLAYDACAPKQRTDLVGGGIGGDIEVFGLQAHDQVAYGAAHDKRVVAFGTEHFAYLDGMARDIAAINAVLVARKTFRNIGGRGKQAAYKV